MSERAPSSPALSEDVSAVGSLVAVPPSTNVCRRVGQAGVPALPGTAKAGLRTSEMVVLADGLERENGLLRKQLDRCYEREKTFRAEVDELRTQLEAMGRRGAEAEAAARSAENLRLRQEAQAREELVARLETLQTERDTRDAAVASLREEISETHDGMEDIIRDIEQLQRFVLPSTVASVVAEGEAGGSTLRAAVDRVRSATLRLRRACEAKFETFGFLREHMRGLAAPAMPAMPTSAPLAQPTPITAHETLPLPSPLPRPPASTQSSAGAHGAAEGLFKLRSELQKMEDRLLAVEDERIASARELEAARHSLRVREAEVRELQLVGKYFAGRPRPPSAQEMSAAALAEELRGQCASLTDEVSQLRAERDLMRAERSRAEWERERQSHALGFTDVWASDSGTNALGRDFGLGSSRGPLRAFVPALAPVA